jgi:hypothetical protein
MTDDVSIQDCKEKILACLEASKFEDAIKLKKEFFVSIHPSDIDPIIEKLNRHKKNESVLTNGQQLSLSRQIKAIKAFRDYGPNPEKMIPTIDLPEGYCGKILMVTILDGVFQKMICLRSGDLWHREILKNTEEEVKALGFFSSSVFELGGAHVRFEDDLSITIYKTSDDFGSCDKFLAAKLIKKEYPNRKINITN